MSGFDTEEPRNTGTVDCFLDLVGDVRTVDFVRYECMLVIESSKVYIDTRSVTRFVSRHV